MSTKWGDSSKAYIRLEMLLRIFPCLDCELGFSKLFRMICYNAWKVDCSNNSVLLRILQRPVDCSVDILFL